MKIFILTTRFPYPLDKGDKLRIFNQIKILSKFHKVYLCSLNFYNNKVKKNYIELLENYCEEIHIINTSNFSVIKNILLSLFNKLPFQTIFFYNKKIKKLIHSLINKIKPDHIYCQLTRAGEYVKDVKINKTIDYMDTFSIGMKRIGKKSSFLKRIVYNIEYNRQRNYESKLFDYFDYHTITSKEDKKYIHHKMNSKIKIVKNGIDANFFLKENKKKIFDILFVGNMSYEPNIDAAIFLTTKIIPKIKIIFPNIKLLIAGTNPVKRIVQLKNDNIVVSGWMDDIRHAYNISNIFIAPMRIGTGIQNKVLEAMAMKNACVTTKIVNLSIEAPHNAIKIGENSNELANHCINLLQDKKMKEKQINEAYKYIKSEYNWEKTSTPLINIFKN